MNDIFAEDFDPERDQPPVRKVEVENGAAFLVQRTDPYNLWAVRREHGQVPAQLEGLYTTFTHAEAAIKAYINSARSRPVYVPKVKKNDNQSA